MKQVNIYFDTNIGLSRLENQDRVKTYSFDNDVNFAVICDGMGGENAGSEASQKAIEIIYDRITKVYKSSYDSNMTKNLFLSAIKTANAVIYDIAMSSSSMHGMGTTCVAVLRNESQLYVVSVGDSRAYLVDDGKIHQITKDHTVVMKMYENGEITKEELRNHPQRNYITKAVGVTDTLEPDFFELIVSEKAVVIICSDGLSGCCEDEDILDIVTRSDTDKIASNLVNLALKNGGNDNVTVAVIN